MGSLGFANTTFSGSLTTGGTIGGVRTLGVGVSEGATVGDVVGDGVAD